MRKKNKQNLRLLYISGECGTMNNSRRSRKSFRSAPRSYREGRQRRRGNPSRLKIIILLVILGIFIFMIRSLFSQGNDLSAEATIEVRRGILEFSLSGEGLWTRGDSGQKFLEGDSIRCTGNCEASVELLDGGTIVVLAPNTQVSFEELRQRSSGEKNISLSLESGELWGMVADNEFSKKKSHFLIDTKGSKISALGGIFNITTGEDDLLRVLRGKFELRSKNLAGKISDPLEMVVGQEILMDDAARSLFLSDDAAKAIELLDTSFEESEWNLKNLELFQPQEAAEIRHRIEKQISPIEQDPGKNGLDSPVIQSPASGLVIPAAEDTLQLEGTAPVDAYRISVNGYVLTKFQPGDRKWSYFASKKFGTLVPGENTFKVISISREGKESAPAILEVTYDATSAPVIVAEATSTFPVPVIQSPALADATQSFKTNDPVLDIAGIVDPQTIAVEVNGFRLKKFQVGDTAWKYTANANYGNMIVGENSYTVVAIGPNDEQSSATIRVNYTPQ